MVVNEIAGLSSGAQPGSPIRPGYGCQPRNGNVRRPLRIERRAGIVGIASGKQRVKLIPSRASASMFGVRARLPKT